MGGALLFLGSFCLPLLPKFPISQDHSRGEQRQPWASGPETSLASANRCSYHLLPFPTPSLGGYGQDPKSSSRNQIGWEGNSKPDRPCPQCQVQG